MYNRRYIWLLIAILAMGISGCSKSSPPANSAAAAPASSGAAKASPDKLPHACDLLTAQDAEHVFGAGAHLVRSEVDCDIKPVEAQEMQKGVLGAKIEAAPEAWDGSKQMTMQMDKNSKTVSDIGDDAYIFMNSLFIKKGNAQISVIGSAYLDDKTREDALRYVGTKLAGAL
jgi:hypothetical protein